MIWCHKRNKLGSKLRKGRGEGERRRSLKKRKAFSYVLMKGTLRENHGMRRRAWGRDKMKR